MSREYAFGIVIGVLLIGGLFLYEMLSAPPGEPALTERPRRTDELEDVWDSDTSHMREVARGAPPVELETAPVEEPIEEVEGPAEPAPEEEAEEPGGRIVGQVIDEWGLGVPIARVALNSTEDRRRGRRPARVDEQGNFAFDDVAAGGYRLLAYSDAHLSSEPFELVLAPEQTFEGVTLILRLGLVVSGKVIDAGSSLPIAGAGITTWENTRERRQRITRRAQSADDGSFTLSGLVANPWGVRAQAEGYLDAQTSFELSETENPPLLTITMVRGADLAGRVLNGQGDPVPGAGIYIMRGDDYVSQSRSDDEGYYRTDAMEPGAYTMYARSDDYGLLHTDEVELVDPGTRPYDIRLESSGGVSGIVLLEGTDTPLPARVFVEEANGRVNRRERAGEDGRFEVGALYGGEYIARAWADGYVISEPTRFTIDPGGQGPDLTLRIKEGAVLEGVVYQGNVAYPNATIVLRSLTAEEGQNGRSQAGSNEEGAYRFDGLREGTYEIYARSRDYNFLARQTINLAHAESLPMPIYLEPAAQLSGVVVWSGDEAPTRVRAESRPLRNVSRRARPDETGNFTLNGLYPGRYAVWASRGEETGPVIEVVIEAGRPPRPVQLQFEGQSTNTDD